MEEVENQTHGYKKNYCSNCGKYGHYYKKCAFPITSIGIICISFAPFYLNDMIYYIKYFQSSEQERQLKDEEIAKLHKIHEHIKHIDDTNYDKIIKYLMIQRKHTYSYVELIRGKYDMDNVEYISNIIQYMTMEEKRKVLSTPFNELWDDLWVCMENPNDPKHKTNMSIAKSKFELLKGGFFIKRNEIQMEYCLQKFVDQCKYKYKTPEWGFPKGRRNLKEKNIECANREFQEETNLQQTDYQIVHSSPIEELFIGINNIRYKNIYYNAQVSRKIELKVDPTNHQQKIEIGDIQWFTVQQCLDHIREYDVEKRNVILNNHAHFKDLFFLFQSLLKKHIASSA